VKWKGIRRKSSIGNGSRRESKRIFQLFHSFVDKLCKRENVSCRSSWIIPKYIQLNQTVAKAIKKDARILNAINNWCEILLNFAWILCEILWTLCYASKSIVICVKKVNKNSHFLQEKQSDTVTWIRKTQFPSFISELNSQLKWMWEERKKIDKNSWKDTKTWNREKKEFLCCFFFVVFLLLLEGFPTYWFLSYM
jgi:hypothetical protein